MTKAIMVQGTMSNVGKSLLTAALCRIFRQDGYRVAPFKSQNMALNSFITEDGLEIGRAQAMQAEACGLSPSVWMNPILLKPTTEVGSQVIIHGKVFGNMTAADYFSYKKTLLPQIEAAYQELCKQADVIVIEGAGSPAEINLKQFDIVNMGIAKLTGAPVLLVGDIDRGGVFAQLYGTMALLEPEERNYVKGLVINKFRGDRKILEPGLRPLETLCEVPIAGVVPYLSVDIDEEDSLSSRLSVTSGGGLLDLAVIRFPQLSNFTDFAPLERAEGVSLRYVSSVRQLGTPDWILLPGTKSTIADLQWMRQNGLEAAILKQQEKGTPIFGICGGYQMLGEQLEDPNGVEGGGSIRGMGLLPTETVFFPQKTRRQTKGTVSALSGILSELSSPLFLSGYEIHSGVTKVRGKPFLLREDGLPDGCQKGNVYGTYLHGLFDAETFTNALLTLLFQKKGISPAAALENTAAYKEKQYDLLAAQVRDAMDLELLYRILERGM